MIWLDDLQQETMNPPPNRVPSPGQLFRPARLGSGMVVCLVVKQAFLALKANPLELGFLPLAFHFAQTFQGSRMTINSGMVMH